MGDIINGAFELIGAAFTWRNALQLYRDQEVKGVYWPFYGFLVLWGFWNLYYYPSLGQWLSTAAGLVLVAGNMTWLGLALRYRNMAEGLHARGLQTPQ